jgi:hypothetical protein
LGYSEDEFQQSHQKLDDVLNEEWKDVLVGGNYDVLVVVRCDVLVEVRCVQKMEWEFVVFVG